MSEPKIARFVDLNACNSIFSDGSTFVLRSSEYYRRLHETEGRNSATGVCGGRGDDRELEVSSPNRQPSTFGWLLSCWVILDGETPSDDEWPIFGRPAVATISTPEEVRTALEKTFGIGDGTTPPDPRCPFMCMHHRQVDSPESESVPPTNFDNIIDITLFTKRPKFANQKEYRFALADRLHIIDSYIFRIAPEEYMEKCLINPQIAKATSRRFGESLRMQRVGTGISAAGWDLSPTGRF
jgi:hypothetical protein